MLRVLCDGAVEKIRELSDLLTGAMKTVERGDAADDAAIDRNALEDGLLLRAARRGLTLADVERAYVRAVLRVVGGNKSEAARRLGINRRTLQRRLGDDGDIVGDDDITIDDDDDDARVAER